MPNLKVDSNITGLSFAEETSIGVLPGTPNWYGLEPNSYSDFGGQIKTVARQPITATRQRRRGVLSDLDAAAGFNVDLVQKWLVRLLQGVLYSDLSENMNNNPMNGAAIPITSVTSGTKTFAAASGFVNYKAGDLVFNSGFTNAGNNGLFSVSSSTAGTLVVNEATVVTEAAPPAAATIQQVGFQFTSGDATITMSGNIPQLNTTTKNLTDLGLTVGEWIWIGGDLAGTSFATANCNCFARISSISTNVMTFDKTSAQMAADAGAGKTIRIFMGNFLKNQPTAANIKRRTYTLERSLGNDSNGPMAEYVQGAVPDQFTLNVPMANKASIDITFVGQSNSFNPGTVGLKLGNRFSPPVEPAYNTSSDVSRIKMSVVDPTTGFATPLFAYLSDLKMVVKNNISGAKAIGTLGAFDLTTGFFDVTGTVTAYFADTTGPAAVRANSDVTIDMVLIKNNAGMIVDIPLLGLDDGRLKVVADKPIDLSLNMSAAQSAAGHTLMVVNFPYLPSLAH